MTRYSQGSERISTITLDGNTLSSSEIWRAATDGIQIQLSNDSWDRIIKSRKVVDDIRESDEIVYGIKYGFGSLINQTIHKEEKSSKSPECYSHRKTDIQWNTVR